MAYLSATLKERIGLALNGGFTALAIGTHARNRFTTE